MTGILHACDEYYHVYFNGNSDFDPSNLVQLVQGVVDFESLTARPGHALYAQMRLGALSPWIMTLKITEYHLKMAETLNKRASRR
jgi:hypothetical protein